MIQHKGTQAIKTNRLLLRRYMLHDAEKMYHNWAQDTRVTKYTSWAPHASVEETKALLSRWIDCYQNDNYYHWVIEYEKEIIGDISVVRLFDDGSAEIGYSLGFDFWNKGIMTEATEAVIEFMFQQVGVKRIIISHATKNPASGRIAQKCGLQYFGTTPEYYKNSLGETFDIISHHIYFEQWKERKTK